MCKTKLAILRRIKQLELSHNRVAIDASNNGVCYSAVMQWLGQAERSAKVETLEAVMMTLGLKIVSK